MFYYSSDLPVEREIPLVILSISSDATIVLTVDTWINLVRQRVTKHVCEREKQRQRDAMNVLNNTPNNSPKMNCLAFSIHPLLIRYPEQTSLREI